MADFGLTKGSVKGLGAGAYLVNVFPSAVLTIGVGLLVASHLYPWEQPLKDDHGRPVSPGVPSVTQTLHGVGVANGVLIALTVLVAAVLLRPFQISAVQLLEGYWRARPLKGIVYSLAVEHQIRRWSLHRRRVSIGEPTQRTVPAGEFAVIVKQALRTTAARRRVDGSKRVAAQYPATVALFMPTLLGNVLRRAETVAGERYGLTTVTTYPRLYPLLSAKLSQDLETQLNVLDTSCSLAIVNGLLAVAAAPLVARLDQWSLVSLALLVAAGLSYRGARIAAGRQGDTLSAAFDLHRFELLKALHRRMPDNVFDEFSDNEQLSEVFGGARPLDVAGDDGWTYVHPASAADSSPDLLKRLEEASGAGGEAETGEDDDPAGDSDQ